MKLNKKLVLLLSTSLIGHSLFAASKSTCDIQVTNTNGNLSTDFKIAERLTGVDFSKIKIDKSKNNNSRSSFCADEFADLRIDLMLKNSNEISTAAAIKEYMKAKGIPLPLGGGIATSMAKSFESINHFRQNDPEMKIISVVKNSSLDIETKAQILKGLIRLQSRALKTGFPLNTLSKIGKELGAEEDFTESSVRKKLWSKNLNQGKFGGFATEGDINYMAKIMSRIGPDVNDAFMEKLEAETCPECAIYQKASKIHKQRQNYKNPQLRRTHSAS